MLKSTSSTSNMSVIFATKKTCVLAHSSWNKMYVLLPSKHGLLVENVWCLPNEEIFLYKRQDQLPLFRWWLMLKMASAQPPKQWLICLSIEYGKWAFACKETLVWDQAARWSTTFLTLDWSKSLILGGLSSPMRFFFSMKTRWYLFTLPWP